MTDITGEIIGTGSYRTPMALPDRSWRILHPRGTILGRAYVGFVVGQDPKEPVAHRNLGLISGQTPPDEALQFGREQDARYFAQAFLVPDITWEFVGPAAPPAWTEGEPPRDLLLYALEAMNAQDAQNAAEEALRP